MTHTLADAVQAGAPGPAQAPHVAGADIAPIAPIAPVAPIAIPAGGGRVVIDRDGDRTTLTSSALPPEVMMLVQRAEETAFGLMGLLAVIIIVGPFARMFARRMEKRTEVGGGAPNAQLLQQQLAQLQQSVDAMSIEVERISEGQRFQSKLLNEKRM